jgi:hypothetical protein
VLKIDREGTDDIRKNRDEPKNLNKIFSLFSFFMKAINIRR